MNKELIKKYKKEFDYWLSGGEILKASWDFEDSKMSAWYQVYYDETWDFSNVYDYKFIIDDEFAEFRKALAEGKIIQYKTVNCDWIDYTDDKGDSCSVFDNGDVYTYRVKPEEHKFKVGDWVTEQSVILQIPEPINEECLNNHLALYERRCKKWEPQVGEVHWFAMNKDKEPILGKFVETEYWKNTISYKICTSLDANWTCSYFQYCEPHIGTLPTKWRNK